MFTIQPGKTKNGKDCLHCLQSMKSKKTYCSIVAHHQVRYIKSKTKNKKTNSLEKIRKISQEYSYRNLITSVILMFPQVKTIEDINRFAPKVSSTQLATYLINLHLSNSIVIHRYMEYMHEIKSFFPSIQEARILKKGTYSQNLWDIDIIIRNLDNQQFGLVTVNNHNLIHRPLGKLITLPTDFQRLKKEYLEYYGYFSFADSKSKETKDNMIYTPGKNTYWDNLIKFIETNKTIIENKLSETITFSRIHFPVYLLDNKGIVNLNSQTHNFQNLRLVLDNSYLRKSSIRFYLEKNNQRYFILQIFWSEDFYQEPEFTISQIVNI